MTAPRITFIGGGNMAASLIGGMRAQGVAADSIAVSDPNANQRDALQTQHGIRVFADNTAAVEGAEIIVLAVKPQMMEQICRDLAPALERRPLIISIAAGITCANLQQWLGELPTVRCMPNTPALLRQGISGLYASEEVSNEQRAQASRVLESVGAVVWLDNEQQINAVTAVSGSGPAYFFLMIEAMTAAGEQLGLSHEVAAQLTLQTALGAARMACESGVEAAELRRRVTSPNGTTAAAIAAFEEGDFRELVATALKAASDRSVELAG